MRSFIYSLMTDKRKGGALEFVKLVLLMASVLYGMAIFVRALLYRFGVCKSRKVPLKVISVGNLTLGGTGKTPFVIYLANLLEREMRRKTSVLIRGYGWDEQAMLKKDLPETPVIVGEDRVRSSHRAVKLYGSDTAILDDGFQYWELVRDLNIVLVDSRNPFGNGFLFPRGILRESKASLQRADVVAFTKVNKRLFDLAGLEKEIRDINPHVSFIEAIHKSTSFVEFKTLKSQGLGLVANKRLVLISSIGDPEYFFLTAKDLGAEIVDHVIFDDHHDYRQSDVDDILRRCAGLDFDYIVTTEKDAVKLERMRFSFGKYHLLILVIQTEVVSGKEMLIDRLNSLYTG